MKVFVSPAKAYALAAAAPADWLARVPVPVFGAALGVLGLSLIAEANSVLAHLPMLGGASMVLGIILLIGACGLHLARILVRREAFLRDMGNAALAPFFAQAGIALLLLAEGLRSFDERIAGAAFVAGSLVSLMVSLWWLVLGVRARFALALVSPGWLVPPIALLYIGLLAPAFGFGGLALPALVAGALAAALSLGLLCARLMVGPPLPAPARPALAIAVAIPALILLALMASATLKTSMVATFVFGVTLFAYLAALLALARLVRTPFVIAWWAYGMPLVAAAMAFDAFTQVNDAPALAVLAQGSAMLSVIIVVGLFVAAVAGVRRHLRQR